LFIISCDLFSGPKVDLFKVISDEVDWAKAPKLTVRVEHPAIWGVSNPMGNITPTKDIRKGYAFEIEFTPDLAYSLDEWRAYLTASLPADWLQDPTLLDDIERLDGESVIVPELPARGGIGKFTINTTENVTLVPWCKTEPYVLRTVPRNSPSVIYPRGTTIEIFFNAPLFLTPNEELSHLFTEGIIKITAKEIDNEDEPILISNNNYSYNYPVYTANNDLGEYKITITPTNAPGNSLIEVTAGPDIRNASNTPMAKPEVFSFNTYPASGGGSIDTWSAVYNESARTIEVRWTTTGEVSVEARYRVNNSADIALSGGSPVPIRGVGALNNSGVRDGREVSGIQEYEIFLDLIVEGLKSNIGSKSFKIWNIPGMSVANNNPIIEINTEADLTAIRTPATDNHYYGLGAVNAVKQYVLTDDITIETAWTPMGTADNSFHGKFYGNGHTVTIKKITAVADTGLFGVVNNCLIRDLTVNYYNTNDNGDPIDGGTVIITSSFETRFGGITGTMSGTAKMENVLVKGAVSVTVDTDHDLYTGGIAGLMLGASEINNAYGGLNLTVNHPNASLNLYKGSSVMVGGITGSIGIHHIYLYDLEEGGYFGGGTSADSKIFNATVEGNITVDASTEDAESDYVQMGLFTGGIVGILISQSPASPLSVSSAELNNSFYRRGIIDITSRTGKASFGGIIGHIEQGKILNCNSLAGNLEIKKIKDGLFIIGGFVGGFYSGLIENCYSENPIFINSNSREVHVGGFGGVVSTETKYCYTKSPVTVEAIYGYIGGFAGSAQNSIKYCYASGDVKLKSTQGGLVGGFSGIYANNYNNKDSIEDCYALGNIDVQSSSNSTTQTQSAGFIGHCTGFVNRCFSTGMVVVSGNNNSLSGGFFGFLNNNNSLVIVQNNAALGKSITKTSATYIGRVYGAFNNYGTVKNNYAYSGMLLNGSTVSGGTHDNQNGANVTFENFHFQDFWRNAPPASGAPTATSGLGFKSEDWIFTTVGNYGYPILRASKNGPEMAGQR
jgi:hypothetical protein